MSGIEVSTRRPGQVFAFVSAKGGTGKTIMAVSAAYYLQRAGKKVALIDTDFSTRGLSLYVLGRVVHGTALNFAIESCLADSILGGISPHKIQPRTVVYANADFEIVVANRDMWRGGVPDDRFLGAAGDAEEPGERRLDRYFQFLRQMCEALRDTYDYVIIDTRGGYDFTSAAPPTAMS
jgi:cellulose biosynthesis protein BcsQ